ncbi:MAG: ligase-associated DNA damage response endonuclease PdeM [Bacteroidota bacterium]
MKNFPHAHQFQLAEQHFWLHPLKAIFWQEANMLILADLHLGKATHFRKAGIAAPKAVEDTNFDHLISLLLTFSPERVLLLGDLFHSDYNTIWEEWEDLLKQFSHIRFELVPGNHDVLSKEVYQKSALYIQPTHYNEGPFCFTHEPLTHPTSEYYNLCGHIHPGVRLEGLGRQTLRLPCFYFGQRQGILPAFGSFTGLATLAVKREDQVFGIADSQVIPLT